MSEEVVSIKEIEIAFYRFNRYADALLKSDYWTFKHSANDFISFCQNNRVLEYILNPFMTNENYRETNLKDLIVRNGKLELPEDLTKYPLVYKLIEYTAKGIRDVTDEFIKLFSESNKNNAIYKFNSYLTKTLINKLSSDFQGLYNNLFKEKVIYVKMLGIYENLRVSRPVTLNYDNNDEIDSDNQLIIDYEKQFADLKELINANPRILEDSKVNIYKDIEDIEKELKKSEINKGNLFNIINSIGLKSNWVIGKMDETVKQPLISELVKIWALRQIGVSK